MDIPRTDDERAHQLMHDFTVQSLISAFDAHDRQEIARYQRMLGIDHEGDDAA